MQQPSYIIINNIWPTNFSSCIFPFTNVSLEWENISFGFGSNCFLGMNWMLGGLEPLCLRKKSPRLAKGLKGQKIKRTAQLNKKKKRGKVSFQKRSLQQAYLNPRVYSQIVVVVEGKIEGFLILWTRSQLENCLCFNENETS